ncbi:class I SAM-dependent methyltransferase [Clostridium sp. YIM B02505]|uniref:Class I SAM-dependent methyltransferase n=1 Tax=Clostridium yunnanense TaxID=2800325 RepID=A0ABS1EVD7_9CLOT|nr:class I SAM-dependent methyltransferase [Clostridium yunnanense]MBK1813258.1 class I SAM-dependent methyltransferase [Clostridium yunnanense]
MEKVEPYKGIAAAYDKMRPSYPEKLIQDVISITGVNSNDRLLEIGAGTGKATVQFAEKAFNIHAIELGEDMAKILKEKCTLFPNVIIDVVSFEDWDSSSYEKYDMVYSAQAFHWIDKNFKYKKCYEILNDNGYLVLFWYNSCDEKIPKTKEIQEKIDIIINKYVSNYYESNIKPQRREHDGVYKEDERIIEIKESGLFKLIDKLEYYHETQNNAEQYLQVMESVPAFASILDGLNDEIIKNMKNEIKELINEYGGYVSSLLEFSLYITQKIG